MSKHGSTPAQLKAEAKAKARATAKEEEQRKKDEAKAEYGATKSEAKEAAAEVKQRCKESAEGRAASWLSGVENTKVQTREFAMNIDVSHLDDATTYVFWAQVTKHERRSRKLRRLSRQL